jgi:hypothetical protein
MMSRITKEFGPVRSKCLIIAACPVALLLGAILAVSAAATHARLTIPIIVLIAAGVVGGLLTLLLDPLGRRHRDARRRRIDPRPAVAGFVAAVVSGLLYSVVHEFGHVIFGIAAGGTVESVTWTIFGNTQPHVSYACLPACAAPWAHAGGYLFPTGLALFSLAVWYFRRRHWSPPATAVLLVFAALMLLPNWGCLPELFDEPNSHFGRFAAYYGIGRSGEVLVVLAFAGASTAILVAELFVLKHTSGAAGR